MARALNFDLLNGLPSRSKIASAFLTTRASRRSKSGSLLGISVTFFAGLPPVGGDAFALEEADAAEAAQPSSS
jgi:hypothetical protein